MYEKISEIPIREEKIKKLKEKILTEIDKYLVRDREEMRIYLMENDTDIEDWNFLIIREFSLLRLKEYIENDNSFWAFEGRCDYKDIITYQISDKKLNIWLQDDYNFTSNYLYKIEFEGFCDVYEILNDRYFGYEFTNIFDEIQYNDRMKNGN